ncbi:MAG: ATP-grasp domain-containing protein [Candidatus Omnitrophica bacterium]|nr:ATP-grasp domain-containing protein [Candidatus Omnitrophota bacterium]
MQVALTYNLKEKDESKPADYFSEFDSQDTINAIIGALHSKGHRVLAVNATDSDLYGYFRKNRVDIVFNIAEGKSGKFRESEIPAILDYLNIPYTGSTAFSLALALNKNLTKKMLIAEGIPTPHFQVFSHVHDPIKPDLTFPLIVKPNREGSAKGIDASNVVHNEEGLRKKIAEVLKRYSQEILVEEFIEGKELTVGILENGKTVILPILEIDFSSCTTSGEFFYSWRMKEYQGDQALGLTPTFHCPARLDKETEHKVKEVALKTHHAVGCLDISRTDIRLSKDGIPFVLEINPLPGLDPKESNFPIMAYAAGMKYEDLIEAILLSALQRRKEQGE